MAGRTGKRPLLPEVDEIARLLQAWYSAGHRDLPWRNSCDPYSILVSEVMLQQTRVEKVLAYYGPFVERFPTPASLAGAGEAEVLKAWEGLGYYRRARLLTAAARALEETGWPRTLEGLTDLPGVGRSTAGALASIAFGLRAPILDGNVKRVWSRLAAYREVLTQRNLAPLWALSEEAVRHGDPGRLNQALMELGATVCLAKRPKCGGCPVRRFCRALEKGSVEEIPVAPPRKARPLFRVSIGLIWRGGAFLVSKRPSEGFLGGLWELPGGKWEPGESAEEALHRELREELGIGVVVLEAHAPIRHVYSHFEVLLHPFTCALASGGEPESERPLLWIAPGEVPSLAFPSGTLKVFASILDPAAGRGLSRVAEPGELDAQ